LFLKSQPPLILASTSPYRRELLERLGLTFACVAPGVDETRLPGEQARALVSRLAGAKARRVAEQRPDAWVIGSDQMALLHGSSGDERVIGKPGTAENCVRQLQEMAGQTLSFLTAVALVRHSDSAAFEFMDTTRVIFRPLDLSTIERYVQIESPLDCAGGFKSEGLGIALCDSIESSDPSALIGLPLIRLAAVLRCVGFLLP
jgi:septum formation protein